MKDNCFIDSNILIYAHTDLDKKKQDIAQKLLKAENLFVSTHILMEITNVFSKRFIHDWKIINKIIRETSQYFNVHIVGLSTIELASQVALKNKYSFYDSLVIASAIESKWRHIVF